MSQKGIRSGYTLAEVLIGIVLLGVGLVAVMGVYPMALNYIYLMEDRVFVIQQAQAKMETVKSMNYSILEEQANLGAVWSLELQKSDWRRGVVEVKDVAGRKDFNNYPVRITFSHNETLKNIVKIKLEIYWTEDNHYGKGMSSKSYVLEGYKAKIE